MAAGCTAPPPEPDFAGESEASRLAAARLAVAEGDTGAIPGLIEMLGADAPGLRLVAIESLERLTGERHGYEYHATESARVRAIDRWVAWYEAGEGG